MAEQFLDRRGRVSCWGSNLLAATTQNRRHSREIERQRIKFEAAHPEIPSFALPPMNTIHSSPGLNLRFIASTLSGKYFQTHRPILAQNEPVGHSVRFGYTMAAQTRLLRQNESTKGFESLEAFWESMVRRRMYVTGGLGSLPVIEGFGRDFELDPHLAYAETCAAIAGILWDWEMLLQTDKACYAELMEWQLYNAALVGVGLNGRCYLYNNPLSSDGELTREPWFRIPCCPSNISRMFAALGGYLYTSTKDVLTIQQYISSKISPDCITPLQIKLDSGIPRTYSVRITILKVNHPDAHLRLRIPGWSEGVFIAINGKPVPIHLQPIPPQFTSGGYSPYNGQYLTLPGPFKKDDQFDIEFHPAIKPHRVDPRAELGQQDTAISYGPLVFCAESVDNPEVELDSVTLDLKTFKPSVDKSSAGGFVLDGSDMTGQPIRLIPYFAWANRGASHMRVFFAVR